MTISSRCTSFSLTIHEEEHVNGYGILQWRFSTPFVAFRWPRLSKGTSICSFIIDTRDVTRFAAAVDELNVAVKFHGRCARIALTVIVHESEADHVLAVFSRFCQPARCGVA